MNAPRAKAPDCQFAATGVLALPGGTFGCSHLQLSHELAATWLAIAALSATILSPARTGIKRAEKDNGRSDGLGRSTR